MVLPDLEKYKAELKHKKEFFKPIDTKEIKQHEKKYMKFLKEKTEEKKKERMQWYQDIGFGEYDESRFKTRFLEKFLQNEKDKKDQEEIAKRERAKNAQKAEQYAKFVKEMHWPKVSKIK